MKFEKKQKNRGFTLIEILVVIAIVASLSAISFAAFNVLVRRSNDKATEGSIKLIEAKVARFLSDGLESLPAGDGSATSSAELYELLTGDTTHDGVSDDTSGEEALWPELLSDALNEKKDGSGKLVKLSGMEMVIVDPYFNPLRYFHDATAKTGKKNGYQNGYDIWAAGEDGVTVDNPDTSNNNTKDDVTNWSN